VLLHIHCCDINFKCALVESLGQKLSQKPRPTDPTTTRSVVRRRCDFEDHRISLIYLVAIFVWDFA
jgi:hypothetical protein